MEECKVTDSNILVQARQLGHLLGRQFEIEDVQILFKASGIRALGNGGYTSVDNPAEEDLRWRLAMACGNLLHLRDVHQVRQISHDARSSIKLGDSLGSQRGVGSYGNVFGLAEVDQISLLQINVVLNLVVGRPDLAVLQQTGHLILAEVGYPNGLGETLLHQGLHSNPDGCVVRGNVDLH